MASISIQPFKLSNGLSFSGGSVSKKLLYLNTNKPAAELGPLSLTHGDQAALYFAGLCDKYGIETGLDKQTKKACCAHYDAVHDNRGRGNWNNDAVLYDTELEDAGLHLLPGMIQEGSIAVPWIVRPEWENRDGVYTPKMGKQSRAVIAVLPPSGYSLVHLRDPNTGWVLQTRPSREEAEKLVAGDVAKFISDIKAVDLAREEVSYSTRNAKGQGKSAVFRGFYSDDVGPFYEGTIWGGGNGGPVLGAFSF